MTDETSPTSPCVEHYRGTAVLLDDRADGAHWPPTAPAAAPTLHYRDARADIHKVVVGDYVNNVFIVQCRQTGDAMLIDAANEHDRLLELATNLGVRHVVETHGHHDHIGAVTAMRDAGYDVWVHPDDAHMLPSYDQFIHHDDRIEVGRLRLRAIHNPGHTAGSLSFALEGSPVLFSGDTLFPGGPGATHFPGGDFEAIIDSIDRLMFAPFDGDTIVMPGHGDDTTIGQERPHLQEWVDRGW